MKKTILLQDLSLSKRLTFSAVFAALCCVGTLFISIPLPSSGYFNAGDIFVLAAGWCLGPIYGGISAAIGSALADLFIGYAIYAPATFFIKGIDAFIAYTVWAFLKKFIKKDFLDTLLRILSACLAETCMALGYFLFEGLLLSNFAAALPNVIGNITQGVCCIVAATALIAALFPVKRIRAFFPCLGKINR